MDIYYALKENDYVWIKQTMDDALFAIINGDTDMVRFLLTNGADVNCQNEYGNTALMFACANGQKDKVEILLENGANVNSLDEKGLSAIDYAKRYGHTEIVKILE
jgi:ankyrin repeat protein